MKTIAQMLDLPDDPAHEAAALEFNCQSGRLEQMEAQERLSSVEYRRFDWVASWKIVRAWIQAGTIGAQLDLIQRLTQNQPAVQAAVRQIKMDLEGITEEDVAESIRSLSPRSRP